MTPHKSVQTVVFLLKNEQQLPHKGIPQPISKTIEFSLISRHQSIHEITYTFVCTAKDPSIIASLKIRVHSPQITEFTIVNLFSSS